MPRKKPNRKFIPRQQYRKLNKHYNHNKTAVVNLSNYQLSQQEISVLSKGLSFCPTPKPPDQSTILRDIFIFNRRLRLNVHFKDQTDNINPNPFHIPSGWTPPSGKNIFLDSFINILTHQCTQTNEKRIPYRNLTNEEFQALSNLKNNQNIIIKPADKGGAIVILNREDYISEAHRQLNNQENYTLLETDITPKIIKTINEFVQRVKHLIPPEILRYNKLQINQIRTPIFYMLPKIHKAGNPGRPIVSAVGGPTEKLSATVDFFPKPLAQNVNSYIKDTNDFLLKLQNLKKVPRNSILVTADVSSLYTSIPHRNGILACKKTLDTRENPTIPTWIILRFLHLILTKTCFEFNGNYYLQTQGTSMGTKCAPNYAIIFMDHLETEFLRQSEVKPLIWWRYIDDIFLIWTESSEDLHAFMSHLNEFHRTIKFTYEHSTEEINFLDTTVRINNLGELSTTLYTKPTDAHLYLHYNSNHPKHMLRSIPFSQALRIRRICSSDNDFEAHATIMKEHFLARSYPSSMLEQAIEKARKHNRNNLLTENKNKTHEKRVIPLVTTFNRLNPEFRSIINKYKTILEQSPDTKELMERIIIAYKRPPNLRSILVHSKLNSSPENIGSHPCYENYTTVIFVKKSYCRKDVVQRHIAKEHPDTEFKESLIFTCTNLREIAEKPKEWKRPFESRPRSTKTPIFRILPANKSYEPTQSTSTETVCQDELPPGLQNRSITVHGIYGLFN
ncbi:uncharacterized protein LOC134281322 [Saccostrea cucullata]|uniref:uncharacterized protein LOC134281322 n=1 Tax=Saccostrea cuccullata TaxID=36930 RepID=UPI002ED32B00